MLIYTWHNVTENAGNLRLSLGFMALSSNVGYMKRLWDCYMNVYTCISRIHILIMSSVRLWSLQPRWGRVLREGRDRIPGGEVSSHPNCFRRDKTLSAGRVLGCQPLSDRTPVSNIIITNQKDNIAISRRHAPVCFVCEGGAATHTAIPSGKKRPVARLFRPSGLFDSRFI
jgi:hypothetical protein